MTHQTIDEARRFLEIYMPVEVEEIKQGKKKTLNISFKLLQEFSPDLAENFHQNPDEFNKILAVAVMDLEECETCSTVQLLPVEQVERVERVEQIKEIPEYLTTNKTKVLYLLSVVKYLKQHEICDFLKIDKSNLSRIISYPERSSGLVEQGYVQLDVQLNVFNLTESGKTYLRKIAELWQSQKKSQSPVDKNVSVQISDLPESYRLNIGDIRSAHLNKLYSTEGVVRVKSDVLHETKVAKFECPTCGNVITVIQLPNSNFIEPSKCTCGRKGKFKLIDKSMGDFQRIVLEDLGLRSELKESKRKPVFLRDALCNQKLPVGGRVVVVGIIREAPIEKHGVKQTTSDTYIEALSIRNLDEKAVDVSVADKELIELNCKEPGVLKRLAKQVAPHIFGNEEIKQALLLQLVSSDKGFDEFSKRGRIHTFIVGDYASGKTQMALYSHKISLKSIYANVSQASQVGLTAAVIKDDFLKSYVLEAGAIALAGDGLCVIDEIDKTNKDDNLGLGEPMENGTITISKANIHQTIHAPSKLLACGNFVKGHEEISPEGTNVDGHVLNRFDLIFRPEPVGAMDLASKVLAAVPPEEGSLLYLQKHIALSSKFEVDVKLTDAVRTKLSVFFVSVKNNGLLHSAAIGARLLEGLWRLSVASAKLRLSPVVEEIDADIAIALVKKSLQDRGISFPIISETRLE